MGTGFQLLSEQNEKSRVSQVSEWMEQNEKKHQAAIKQKEASNENLMKINEEYRSQLVRADEELKKLED